MGPEEVPVEAQAACGGVYRQPAGQLSQAEGVSQKCTCHEH